MCVISSTKQCILEFSPADPIPNCVVVDEALERENQQPYTDTHASYNTAKLQMVNQKKLRKSDPDVI